MIRSKIKGFSKDAVLYGAGETLGRLIGFVMLPILSRVFAPQDYGAIDLLTVSYAFLFIAVQLGVPTGFQRLYFKVTGAERRALTVSCLAYLVGITILVGGVIIAFAGPIRGLFPGPQESIGLGVRLLAMSLPFEIAWDFHMLLLRLQRRAVLFSAVNVSRIVITPSLTVVFVVILDYGIAGVFIAKLCSLAVLSLTLTYALRREIHGNISLHLFLRVFRFGVPGHPGTLIRNSLSVLPQYMLAAFAPMTAVGIFGIAFRLSRIIGVAVVAFHRAWNPFAYSNEGAEGEPQIYSLVFRAVVLAFATLVLFLSMFSEEVLLVMTPKAYGAASTLVPGIAFVLALEGLVAILSTALYTRNLVRWDSYLNGLRLAVFLVFGFVLVPRYHAAGLVVSMSSAATVYFVAYCFKVHSVLPFAFHSRRVIGAIVITSIGLVSALYLPEWAMWQVILVKTAIGGAVLCANTFVLLTSHEHSVLGGVLRSRFPVAKKSTVSGAQN